MATSECGTLRTTTLDSGMLKCSVREGMFPHELDVTIDGLDERSYEALIDARLVKRQTGRNGLIQVEIVAMDEDRDAALVELPRQVVMGGRRVWVPRHTLVSTD